jgi:hypothetical protein
MQISQLWSVVNYVLLKIKRLFLIRDAKLRINVIKKIRQIQDSPHDFFITKAITTIFRKIFVKKFCRF